MCNITPNRLRLKGVKQVLRMDDDANYLYFIRHRLNLLVFFIYLLRVLPKIFKEHIFMCHVLHTCTSRIPYTTLKV